MLTLAAAVAAALVLLAVGVDLEQGAVPGDVEEDFDDHVGG